MKPWQILSSLVLCGCIFALFYLAGILVMPREYHFEYQKLFLPACLLSSLLLSLLHYFQGNYRRQIKQYLHKLRILDTVEIEEVEPGEPIYEFHRSFVEIVEKVSDHAKGLAPEGVFNPLPFIQSLYGQASGLSAAEDFLGNISSLLPKAEIYLFSVGSNRIYPLSQVNADSEFQDYSSKPAPAFSVRSEFSGKVFEEGLPYITNELKADPNLGQFLSEKNPNIPIYGALFPLGDGKTTRAIVWIRDEKQGLEFLDSHQNTFQFLFQALFHKLFPVPNLANLTPSELPSFVHFEHQAQYYLRASQNSKNPLAVACVFLKFKEASSATEHRKTVLERLPEQLPRSSIFCKQDQLIFFAFHNLAREEAMLKCAHLLDKVIRYMSLEHGDEPIGEVNLALVLEECTQDSEWSKILRKVHEVLKISISEGPNLMRVHPKEDEDEE